MPRVYQRRIHDREERSGPLVHAIQLIEQQEIGKGGAAIVSGSSQSLVGSIRQTCR